MFNPLKLLGSLGGLASGFKGMAIAAGVAFAIGLGTGWKGRDALCDAAAAKAERDALARQLEAAQVAGFNDAKRAQEAAARAAELETRIDALKVSVGVCFPADDADRVRDLWRRR